MIETGWILHSLQRFAPELVLIATLLLVVLFDLFKMTKGRPVAITAVVGIALSLFAVYLANKTGFRAEAIQGSGMAFAPRETFLGAFAFDSYSLFFKTVFLVTSLIVLVFSVPVIKNWASGQGEFLALLISCTIGMMLMAGANDLLMMYLALEFVSITSYIMAGLLRRNRRSAEASLKYIIYGAAASGLMIYGLSFLYGLAGTLDVTVISERLASLESQPQSTFYLITSVLIMAGFGYKIAAAPFHMWCPDVYEGAPTPVTAFFSVGPKAAGFAMLARFLSGVFGGDPNNYPFEWTIVVAVMALLTLAIGNFGAMPQQNLKRLFAYSSIAHAGFMLLAFTVFRNENIPTVMFYVCVYVIMNLGAFLVVIILEEQYGIETVKDCAGIGWKMPVLGVSMAVFCFSLTGLPPTAGFWGKLYLFAGVLQSNTTVGSASAETLPVVLVVIAVLFSVVALYYYMRILAAMFLTKPPEPTATSEAPIRPVFLGVLVLLALATVGFGLFPNVLLELAQDSAKSFLGR